jgi:hypothetical protein
MTPTPDTMSLITILAAIALLLLAGIILIRRSRRRVGTSPHCPGCDYLLYGNTSAVCPECGRALSPQTIVIGDVRRSRAMLGWGLLLIAIALLLLATVGIKTVATYDWYRLRPTAWVIDDTVSRDPSADVSRAWRELTRRRALHKLSDDHEARLTQLALAEQANANQDAPPKPTSPIIREFLEYLGDRQLAGQLSSDQSRQFFENSARVRLGIRPSVVAGDVAPIEVTHLNCGPSSPWFITVEETTLTVASMKPIIVADGGSTSGVGAGTSSTHRIPAPAPGDYPVAVTQRVRIYDRMTKFAIPPAHEWTVSAKGTLHVVPPSAAAPIKRITDPTVSAKVRSAISVKQVTVTPGQFPRATLDVDIRPSPAPLAFEVLLASGGEQFPVGTIHLAKGAQTQWKLSGDWPKDLEPAGGKVDVIFRPSEKVARETIDLLEMWGEEVVIKDVPVAKAPR